MLDKIRRMIWITLPALVFVLAWEIWHSIEPSLAFFFGSPSGIVTALFRGMLEERWIYHFLITASETVLGFIIGISVGGVIGFSLLSFRYGEDLFRGYILTLGSVPIFALGPMMIIWFGPEFGMKVALAALSTVFVAASICYTGGRKTESEFADILHTARVSKGKSLRLLVIPNAFNSIMASFRMCIGLALLGAFIGEFIASDRGLGRLIIMHGSLYQTNFVLAAVILLVILSIVLDHIMRLVESRRHRILNYLFVPIQARNAA